jgi:hypothetical protein
VRTKVITGLKRGTLRFPREAAKVSCESALFSLQTLVRSAGTARSDGITSVGSSIKVSEVPSEIAAQCKCSHEHIHGESKSGASAHSPPWPNLVLTLTHPRRFCSRKPQNFCRKFVIFRCHELCNRLKPNATKRVSLKLAEMFDTLL